MENQEKSTAPFLALIPAQLLFGSLPVIGKIVLAVLPPMALVGIRVAITAAILFVIQAFRSRIWLKEKGDYWRFAALSLFGVVFNQLFFIGGLSLTTASNTSLLAVMIPVFALAVGSIAGFEKLTVIKIIGIIFAAAGVIFLIDPRKASFSSQTTVGDIFIIINCLAYGIYVATSKGAITRNGTFRSMMWVFIFASIICIPLGAFSLLTIDLAAIDTNIWLISIYIAVGATAAPYLLNAWALSKVNPSTVAVFVYLQPLIGFGLAVLFLGEKINLTFIISAALIFAGVFLVTKKFIPSET
ncbi:MAG: DMT family transporter [Pyrinomonadaceae bacterium]|nr:DMT family transporter [Chloracidobacterium sp.]MBP7415787.1 DMT family transporter [Pyrinomonadaceae bacterium]